MFTLTRKLYSANWDQCFYPGMLNHTCNNIAYFIKYGGTDASAWGQNTKGIKTTPDKDVTKTSHEHSPALVSSPRMTGATREKVKQGKKYESATGEMEMHVGAGQQRLKTGKLENILWRRWHRNFASSKMNGDKFHNPHLAHSFKMRKSSKVMLCTYCFIEFVSKKSTINFATKNQRLQMSWQGFTAVI